MALGESKFVDMLVKHIVEIQLKGKLTVDEKEHLSRSIKNVVYWAKGE